MTWMPALIVLAVTIAAVVAVQWFFRRRGVAASEADRFRSQAITVGLVFVGFIVLIFLLPESVDGSLALSAVGLVVTGALAISSQSIIANGMAGVMLRSIKSFKPGDFIEVGEHMGRVSEMGLFHTEIQTRDRDLITLPNAVMVNEPVRVVRSSGTIVSVEIGLGYDLSRYKLKEIFIKAAETAELEDPFVQVVELGDYAVTYRVAGFLAESTQILARRSRLREALLDTMHEAGLEIMSPMFVARREASNDALIPKHHRPKAAIENRPTAEDKVFDKAEKAASDDELRMTVEKLQAEVDELEKPPADDLPEADIDLTGRAAELEKKRAELAEAIEQVEALEEEIAEE